MRFKAKLEEISCILHFSRVVSTVSHMAKNCALRLTPNKLYFILNDTAAQGGVTVWCEVNQPAQRTPQNSYPSPRHPMSGLFEEFRIEGNEGSNDNIYLELYPDNLVKAMKSAVNAQVVKIKLTKKITPCLTFEIILPSMVRSRTVTHDTPVNVIAEDQWDAYKEPQMPEYDVSICMPPLKIVRNIVDKMKHFNSQLVISANMNGYMTLKVVTDMVSATTHFRELEVEDMGREDSNSERSNSSQEMSEATVDIRKFLAFLHGQLVSPTKVICNIVHQRAVQFYLIHDDFSLQYFIPAIVT